MPCLRSRPNLKRLAVELQMAASTNITNTAFGPTVERKTGMISVELCVVGGKHAGQSIALTKKKFLIGREQDCQLRPNSELVSRHHCVFTVDDFVVRLRDLGSTNGTSVNGERIRKETVLQPGDRVIVGNLEFQVKVNAPGSEAVPQETTSQPVEDTIVSETDTLTEMPALGGTAESTNTDEDTFIETTPETPAAPVEAAAPEPVTAAAPVTGDTTVIAQPMMMPPQQPGYPQMMPPQQMGYPQMYGQYPYQGMPGQMPMYPPQGYPQQQMYPQQQPQPQTPAPAPPAEAALTQNPSDQPEVSLPDPAETGAKDEPAPAPDSSGAPAEIKSNQSAAEIIKNQMNRRPGG